MKIYAVSSGNYSDYRINGIYSTEEKAEEAQHLYGTDNDIEEYELDALPEHPTGMLYYLVKMDREGNSCADLLDVTDKPEHVWEPYGRGVGFHLWASDKAHATKIANELRVQLIATSQWTTNWDEWHKRKPA